MKKDIVDYKDMHQGKDIIVCGCGESLNSLPLNENIITIGVNDVGRLFDPTYLVVLNHPQQFKLDRYRYVRDSKASAVFSQLPLNFLHPNIVKFKLGQKGGTNFSRPDVLPYTQNSPYVAIGLAVLMGAKRIGLIGVDFTPNHFFGKTGIHPLQEKLAIIDKEFHKLHTALISQAVELVNLSAKSRLDSLPKMGIQRFLKVPVKSSGRKPNHRRTAQKKVTRRKTLDILQIAKTNCAGAIWNLHEIINKYTPHKSRVITCSRVTNGRLYPQDVLLNDSGRVKRLIKQADVIHFHNWLDKDSELMKPFRDYLYDKSAVLQFHSEPAVLQQAFPGRNLVSRNDMLTLVVAQKQARFFPQAQPVPNAIDINMSQFLQQPGECNKSRLLRVLYAPTDRKSYQNYATTCNGKGFIETQAILKKLSAAGIIEPVIVYDLSWDVLAELRWSSDVVIDECVTGGYHLSSLEALAQGCVTIAFLDIDTQALLKQITGCKQSELPWLNSDLSCLEDNLRKLARNWNRVLKLKEKSREWMKNYWQPEKIVEHYIQLYFKAMKHDRNNIQPHNRAIKSGVKTKSNISSVISMANTSHKKPAVFYKIAGKINPRRSEEFAQTIRLSPELQNRKDSLKGQPCHILGNGPSVNEMDLSLLQGRSVIAVNSSSLLYDELGGPANYYCVSDRRFLLDESSTTSLLKAKQSMPVFAGYCEGIVSDPDINYVKICGGDGISSSISEGFFHNCSVVLFAAQLALWLGSQDIYLHGCEFDYSKGRFINLDPRPHDKKIYPRVRKNADLLANRLHGVKGKLNVVGPSRLVGDFGDQAIQSIKAISIFSLEQELVSSATHNNEQLMVLTETV